MIQRIIVEQYDIRSTSTEISEDIAADFTKIRIIQLRV